MSKVYPEQQQAVLYGFTAPNYGAVSAMAAPRQYFNEHPVPVTCQFCGQIGVTETQYKTGLVNYAAAACVCLVAMPLTWLGCCLIPFCINALKDVEHSCPHCHRVVYKFNRS